MQDLLTLKKLYKEMPKGSILRKNNKKKNGIMSEHTVMY